MCVYARLGCNRLLVLHETECNGVVAVLSAMIHIIWPILGSLIIIYLLFWFISAFGL